MIRLLLTGCVSILGQVILLRELNVAFYGVELIYLAAIGAWMLWTAAGSAVHGRTLDPPAGGIRALFFVAAVLLPGSVALARGLRPLLAGVPGAYLSFPLQVAALLAVLLPAGFSLGLLFQWSAKSVMSRGATLARAYAVESLGGMLGGAAATAFLQLGVSNSRLAVATSLLCLGAARPGLLSGIAVLPLLAAFAAAPAIDRATAGWAHTWNVLESRDTPQGRITVTGREGMVSVFQNDSLWIETEGTDAEELVHLAAANVPDLRSALIVGGAADGTLREVLKHSPSDVECLELNPLLPELLLPFLEPGVRGAFRSAGVRVTHGDARPLLSVVGPRFDLILIGMGEPSSGQTNRFYTREFFELCRRSLRPHGVVAFRLRASENVWTAQLVRRTGSIMGAMRSALGDVVVLPGTTTTFLGSTSVLSREPGPVKERLASRGVQARLVSPMYVEYLYLNPRFREVAQLLEKASSPENSDDRPACYQYTMMLWLSKFLPEAGEWFPAEWLGGADRGAPVLVVIGVVFSAVVAARRFRRIRAALLVAVAGCAGMTMETAILLHYQVLHGALFRDLGILMTGFMAGLAAGALAIDSREGRRKRSGYALVVIFAVVAACTAAWIRLGWDPGLAGSFAALFSSAALVSAVFGWVSARTPGEPRKEIGLLYAADLAGGCAASLIAGLILIPTAGLSATSAMTVPLLLLSLLLV